MGEFLELQAKSCMPKQKNNESQTLRFALPHLRPTPSNECMLNKMFAMLLNIIYIVFINDSTGACFIWPIA